MFIPVIIKEFFLFYLIINFIKKLPWRVYADKPMICFSDHH